MRSIPGGGLLQQIDCQSDAPAPHPLALRANDLPTRGRWECWGNHPHAACITLQPGAAYPADSAWLSS